MPSPAFANILLSGPCNLRCPHCIGRRVPARFKVFNLDCFPLAGLGRFCDELVERGVREVSLTGVDTDPLLYRHQPRLLAELRRRVPGVRVSLHTNGRLALSQLKEVNLYDRVCLSLPSFEPRTCRAMTGSGRVLDLAAILDKATVPIKVSVLVTDENRAEVPAILERCHALGVRRAVLRRLDGDGRPWDLLPGHEPVALFGENPVYDLRGLEVTVWRFDATALSCLNLFPDGSISDCYRLPTV